jgi:hypothetical protein
MTRLGFAAVRRARVVCASVALVAVHTACDDNTLEPPRECNGPLSLTVSSGTIPLFTWTAPCAVARLAVLEQRVLGDEPVVWDVLSEPARIVSPVRYGVRPSSATEAESAVALRSGGTYQLRVYSDAQIVIGSALFTP